MKQKGNNIFTPESLCTSGSENLTNIDEKWVPARPYRCDNLLTRIKQAYMVFTGKYDLIKWYKQ